MTDNTDLFVVLSLAGARGVPGPVGAGAGLFTNLAASRALVHQEQICADSAAGPLALTLPPLATGFSGWAIVVLDGAGQADVNPITLTAGGTDLLDGTPGGSFALDVRRGRLTLVIKNDLSAWQVVVG